MRQKNYNKVHLVCQFHQNRLARIGLARTVGCEFTNRWSNFCDPHWELICHNKWHPETLKIFIPPEIAVGSHFHTWHGTKTILVFLRADGEAFWLLLPSSVSLLSGSTMEPENTIHVSSWWQVLISLSQSQVMWQ